MTAFILRYRFELCWLLVLIAIVLLSPDPPTAQSFSWVDLALDCDSTSGWCLTLGGHDFPIGQLVH
jgi:hypothetical protein